MPKPSNPDSSTVATPAVSADKAAAAPPSPLAQTISEQNAAAAAFLAGAEAAAEPIKAEPIKEIAPEAPDAETLEPEAEVTAEAEASEQSDPIAEPPDTAGPEWLEQVRAKIAETGEVPDWFFERASKPIIKDAEKNAKIRELESKLTELQAVAEAKPTVIVDTPENQFAKLNATELKSNEDYFTSQRAWALRNLTTGGTVGDKDYTPEDAADLLLQAESAIDLIKSAKAVSESRQKHFEEVTKVAYPELAAPGTALRKQVDAIKASKPAYARYADSDTDIADMLAGRKLREDKAKGIQTITVTAKAKPAAAPVKVASSVVGTTPKVAISRDGADLDLATLRKQALNGSERAANQIAAAFLATA